MLQKSLNGAPYFEFQIFQEFRGGLRHTVLSRHIPINPREQWSEILETGTNAASFETQLHGTQAWFVESVDDAIFGSARRQGDVLVTNAVNVPLLIRISDCASILLFDPIKNVIVNIHAGWRGISQKIIHQTVKLLESRFGTERREIRAAISPMLGPCCSRFSDPFRELPNFMHGFINGKNHVDLWMATEEHLRESGIRQEHIENPRMCTLCHPEFFYSNRRNNENGRFGTLIMLR